MTEIISFEKDRFEKFIEAIKEVLPGQNQLDWYTNKSGLLLLRPGKSNDFELKGSKLITKITDDIS